MPWMTRLDYVYGAISVKERAQWPRLGLSVTRRTLRRVAARYTDANVKCLTCFCCAQKRTTLCGMAYVDFASNQETVRVRREIEYWTLRDLAKVEYDCPGTLLNNCGYALWAKRYWNLLNTNLTGAGT